MMITMLIQIETNYACAGIVVNNQGKVTAAAPIFSWMVGKTIDEINKWKYIKNIREVLNEN